MKKKLKQEEVKGSLNLFKTFLTSLVLILIFSILPSSVSFITNNLKSNEIVFNSSKQSFEEILDKQNKKNKVIEDTLKNRFSWNIFDDIDAVSYTHLTLPTIYSV